MIVHADPERNIRNAMAKDNSTAGDRQIDSWWNERVIYKIHCKPEWELLRFYLVLFLKYNPNDR